MSDPLRDALVTTLAAMPCLTTGTVSASNFPPRDFPAGALQVHCFDAALADAEDGGDRSCYPIDRSYAVVISERLADAPEQAAQSATLDAAYDELRELAKQVFYTFETVEVSPDWHCVRREMPTPCDYDARDRGVFRAQMTLTFRAWMERG